MEIWEWAVNSKSKSVLSATITASADSTILGYMRNFPYPLYAQKEVWMHIPWASSNNDLDRWLGLLLTTTNHACTLCSTTLAHDVLSLSWYEGFLKFFFENEVWKLLTLEATLFVCLILNWVYNCTLCSTTFEHNILSLSCRERFFGFLRQKVILGKWNNKSSWLFNDAKE